MISITLVLNLREEATLLWLYTVVFFSTTAHAFAPFKRFLAIYQFIGIVPAAVSTLFVGDVIGLLYAVILLMFYWILHHHSDLMGSTHWGHLEANYALTQKAETLEEEKRDTRASIALCTEFVEQLAQRFHTLQADEATAEASPAGHAAAPVLTPLGNQVLDFYRVLAKDIKPVPRVFNVRHYMQFLVRQHQEAAEKKGIELETAIAPALPSRLIGDATLFGKVVDSVIGQAIAQSTGELILFELEFSREFGSAGQLLLTVAMQSTGAKRKFFANANQHEIQSSLELVLTKGLAEAMEGALEFGDSVAAAGKSLGLRTRMAVAELNPRLDYHRFEYKNKPLLLINTNARWLDHKRLELDTLGFAVATANDFKKAVTLLTQAINQGAAVESVVYTLLPGDDQAVDFANELLAHNDLKYTNQYVVCSRLGRKYLQDRLITNASTLHYVAKPSGLYEFEMAFHPVFCRKDSADARVEEQAEVLWLSSKHPHGFNVFEGGPVTLVRADDKKQGLKLLQERSFKLIVLDRCEGLVADFVAAVRDFENKNNQQDLLPIVAVGESAQQRWLLEQGVDQFIHAELLALGDASEFYFWLYSRQI